MDLLRLYIDKGYSLSLSIHWVVWAILIICLIIFLIGYFKRMKFNKNIEIDSAELGINGQKIKIKPNHINIEIAYKIWIELNTRKIGIPINLEYDVIVEIYDSWYKFFGETRELLKNLPATKIRKDKSTKELIDVTTKILNEGLRPHLTKWQAIYRKWYEKHKIDNDATPQEIQREFPKYQELTKDLIKVNSQMMYYKNIIKELAFGDEYLM